ncbi:AraC family transcriptional regulator [Mycolicibacterium sp. P1-5]|uniref:AraC family transcriptional regulator n=1 Tax=Mycolicibacterium sp. P1-5 TaxID=2024617 RepID=UPI0011ED0B55|nr:AraC family transcriptional regulator [Mycolicibacterium sp. P1-5]KAA0106065.1 AraC family transcriptional regulator [Mycolicibacterium sp. P1-5]
MDALVGLLDGVRAHGAFVLRMVLDPPWSMRIQDEAPLTVICVTDGTAVLSPDRGTAMPLHAGDVALARGTENYVLADSATTQPQVIIHPGQRCTTLSGEDLKFAMALGIRTWGNSVAGATRAVVGAYEGHSAVSARLLGALPDVAVLRSDDWASELPQTLAAEALHDGPGQEAFLDRLLDLLLLDFLRTWFGRAGSAPLWWTAESDVLVGPALRLMYNDPAHPWTVANLAEAVGSSRASFARRFSTLVGESPIAFLTTWRLALAADLLESSDITVAAVARRVGYSTPFALSTAFKRASGLSPTAFRARRT